MEYQCLSRRNFLKTIGLCGLGIASSGFSSNINTRKTKPNVVLIFTDDQGSIDVNCYGAKDLYTPNMDALAKRGLLFKHFYVNACICSPSRAALLTGRYPQRAELDQNAKKEGMPNHQVTIAEVLKKAGYRTAIFGKWHLGENPANSPNAQGFDEFVGHKLGCIDNYSHYFYWHGPNRHDMWRDEKEIWEEGAYFPDMVVSEATRFLEENKDHPFFLYLPFNLPHYPLQGQIKYRDMYKNLDEPRKMYAAFVSTLDEKIGQVVDKIDELGIRENTIIIFLSDHGHSVEERTFGGGGSSGPYRGHKFTFWEGGIRVPCIISWPGHLAENEVREQIGVAMDWMPTIAHYCGAKLPDRIIDGQNIAPMLEDAEESSPHKVIHWQKGGTAEKPRWAVLDGNWKLVAHNPSTEFKGKRIPEAEYFLSDIEKDPGETQNLAEKYPQIVKRLVQLHENWLKEVVEQK